MLSTVQALVNNPPLCPVCRAPVASPPYWLAVVAADGTFTGVAFPYTVLMCGLDGVLFAVIDNRPPA